MALYVLSGTVDQNPDIPTHKVKIFLVKLRVSNVDGV